MVTFMKQAIQLNYSHWLAEGFALDDWWRCAPLPHFFLRSPSARLLRRYDAAQLWLNFGTNKYVRQDLVLDVSIDTKKWRLDGALFVSFTQQACSWFCGYYKRGLISQLEGLSNHRKKAPFEGRFLNFHDVFIICTIVFYHYGLICKVRI